jgi:hypothetical protein
VTGSNPGDLPVLFIALRDQREQVRAQALAGDSAVAERAARGLVVESARVTGLYSELTAMAAIFHCSVLGAARPEAAAAILRDLLDELSLTFGVRSNIATACAGLLTSCLPVDSPERSSVTSDYLAWMLDEPGGNLGPEQRSIVRMLRGDRGPPDG